jgi:DNA polymerase III delta subunit
MIYFFYGADHYRLLKKLKTLKNRFQEVHKESGEFKELEGKEISFPQFRDLYQQSSIFIEHQLIIVRDPLQASEKFRQQLKTSLKELNQLSTLFVFCQLGKFKKSDPLFKAFLKESQKEAFPLLNFQETKAWLEKEAEKYKLSFQPEAKTKLANLIEGNLWLGHSTLEKIAAGLGEKSIPISSEEVEDYINVSPPVDVFKVVNALQEKKIAEALTAISRYLDDGGSPEFLIGQLSSFLARLLTVRSLLDQGKDRWQIKKEVSFNPRALFFLIPSAQYFSAESLKKKIRDLLKTDLQIKTGQKLPRSALNDFLLSFSSTD